jgi:hypothetical protein
MGKTRRFLRRLAKARGVPQARHIAERSIAPYVRADLHELWLSHVGVVDHLTALQQVVDRLQAQVHGAAVLLQSMETHQPMILNAIASTNGTTRILSRETARIAARETALKAAIEEIGETGNKRHENLERLVRDISRVQQMGDEAVRDDFRPHIDTIGFLLRRVETIRAEMMHELRYGAGPAGAAAVEPKIINPAALEAKDLRVNIGAGHIAIEGFVNVDMRDLPGIDVVAPVDALPFELASLAEIFSSHTVEHFPELELRRKLLPYWVSLLRPGGAFRAIVPDLKAMSMAYVDGLMSFEVLRSVLYGGQEYEGDFHFTGFTPASLTALLIEAGLEAPTVIAEGRANGDCLEFEISATKPSR